MLPLCVRATSLGDLGTGIHHSMVPVGKHSANAGSPERCVGRMNTSYSGWSAIIPARNSGVGVGGGGGIVYVG